MKIDEARVAADLTRWLEEDAGAGDITSEVLIDIDDRTAGMYRCKQEGVIAGLDVVRILYSLRCEPITWTPRVQDGDRVAAGTVIAEVSGPIKALMLYERLALNLLQRMSGIATRVRAFVDAAAGTGAQIMDTRKTTPGLRMLEKYAVTAGGGCSHRMGLYDQVLVKDNHLAWLAAHGRDFDAAAVRAQVPEGMLIEVEAATFDQVKAFLAGSRPDIILLDNMAPALMKEIAAYARARAPEVKLEASGGITLAAVGMIAATGVDRISVGELTHSVTALDIGFYV